MLTRLMKAVLIGLATLLCVTHPVLGKERGPQPHSPAEQRSVPIRKIEGLTTPMRDGTVLVATVWLPAAEGKYPVLLMRSPYRMRTMKPFVEIAEFYAGHGYAVVIQDSRGTGDSRGEFNFLFQEDKDGYDSVERLAMQPWSNQRLCMLGYSYLGSVQLLAARERPPHLVCIAPTAPAGRYHEEMPTVQGAFMLHWGVNWLRTWADDTASDPNHEAVDWEAALMHRPLITLDEAVIGRKNRLYREFLENDTLNAYWRRISFTAEDFAKIDLPMMMTTGWFDGDQHGALYYWRGFERRKQPLSDAYLTIGPWNHSQTFDGGKDKMGAMPLPASSILDHRARHLAFFDHYLKQTGPKPGWARVNVFVTGADLWRTFDSLPVDDAERRPLYLSGGGDANTLHGDGKLTWAKPGAEPADEFVYDPRNPVQLNFLKGNIFGAVRNEVQARTDVLVYTTAPLDKPVEIIGAVTLELYAASDARDTDFTAAISDVGPDGKAIILGARPVGIVRARYRNGREAQPTLLTPGKIERYEIDLGSIGHRFMAGHRIRVEISSSAAPFFNPNQNTGNPIATDTEWKTANQTVFHDTARPSALMLPVYEGK